MQHVPRDSNASLPRNPFIKYTFVKYRRNVNNFLPKLQHRTFRTKQFTIVSQFCFSNKGNFPWRQILFMMTPSCFKTIAKDVNLSGIFELLACKHTFSHFYSNKVRFCVTGTENTEVGSKIEQSNLFFHEKKCQKRSPIKDVKRTIVAIGWWPGLMSLILFYCWTYISFVNSNQY